MMDLRRFRRGLTVAGLLLSSMLGALGLLGQTGAAALARLSSTQGFVRVERGDGSAGDPAQRNMPLTEGQTVVAGEDGQAEVEFPDGSLARLTPNTTLVLTRLAGETQLVLVKGLAYFELRSAPGIGYSLVAGDDRLKPLENATVRVNLDEPPAAMAVLDGTVHVERGGSYATDVRAGETFRADAEGVGRYFLTQEIAPETWDQWNEALDRDAADAAAKQTEARGGYAGDQGYGWSDLDANGTWYDVAGQGPVWQPQGGEAAEFDPYGDGSWVWYPNVGYIWASSYSWGWTPFRCGSWSYWDTFGWGWAPGSSCGSIGFGGFGGHGGYGGRRGGLVNVGLPPPSYPVHRPPSPNHPGLHPIMTVHGEPQSTRTLPFTGTRTIAGLSIVPVPVRGLIGTVRSGSVAGAGLLRDYPVDRVTRMPVVGVRTEQGPVRMPTARTGYGIEQVRGSVPLQQRSAPNVMVQGGRASYPAPVSTARPANQGQGMQRMPQMSPAPPRAMPSAPAPAPHMAAPAAAAAPSGKK